MPRPWALTDSAKDIRSCFAERWQADGMGWAIAKRGIGRPALSFAIGRLEAYPSAVGHAVAIKAVIDLRIEHADGRRIT